MFSAEMYLGVSRVSSEVSGLPGLSKKIYKYTVFNKHLKLQVPAFSTPNVCLTEVLLCEIHFRTLVTPSS